MATFTGAPASDYITPTAFSGSVYADPLGSRPSDLADTLYGLGGNDYLDAAGGNDSLYGGSGNDAVYGGAGDDYIDDYALSDSGGDDYMDGGAGNDTIFAGTGGDTLLGGDGADILYGQDGYDTLDGGTGADKMDGGAGSDTYYVDNGGDVVSETDDYDYWSADRVYASISYSLGDFIERLYLTGNSNISGIGNALSNTMEGNSGTNILSGGDGNDALYGEAGADSLNGGNGDDTLDGGEGADTLIGGDGDDVYYVDSSDTVTEAANGGIDTVYARSTFTLGAQVENLTLQADASGYGNSLANVLAGNGYSGPLYGLDGDDTLTSDYWYYESHVWGNATLVGGNGNDVYVVQKAGQIVESAGGGIDTVRVYVYDNNTYVMDANVENAEVTDNWDWHDYYGYYNYVSYIDGNSAANVIQGGESSNVIRGMNGADTIYGNDGADTIDGGGGTDYIDGGSGTDTADYRANTTPVRIDLAAGLASFIGQTWPSETLVSIENAQGGSGNDIFVGSLDGNTLYGNAGDDTFDGAGGTDYFDGGTGIDTVLYTANTTSVSINLANGTASFPGQTWPSESFASIENAQGGSGNDTFVGSSVGNRFYGNAGNDTFDGAGGTDYIDGGAGSDTVLYTANTTAVSVNLATGTVSFPGQTWPSESFTLIENASTGSAGDTLVGSSVANTLRGGGGADKLTGAGGADQLIGGLGLDTFIFKAVSESTSTVRDSIAAGDGAIAFENAGATAGDKIDLSAIDADATSTSTNQAFIWGTTMTKGHLWAASSGTTTLIRGNTDADATVEIEIAISDGDVLASKYDASDFIL